jgi:hypothetical protein
MWEQKDRGGAGAGTSLVSNTKLNGPLFRQFGVAANVTPEGTLQTPSPGLNIVGTDPTRVFPDMAQILANNTNAATGSCPTAPPQPTSGNASNVPADLVECYSEFLPTAAYVGFAGVNAAPASLNFRLTARDGKAAGGGVGNDDTQLVLASTAGPFLVTSQATNTTPLSSGSEQAVTWDVAGTNLPPVGTTDVKISLSTDGGLTWPHVLAETTANDGSETVTLPQVVTDKARIKIEAVGNVYFDVSAVDFPIKDTTAPVVTTPANITANAVGSGAVVAFSATAVDAVDGPVTAVCTPPSGSTFAVGSTTVTCTATDAAGNSSSGQFIVTVLDVTPPVLTLPANITVNAVSPSGAPVGYSATAVDAVDGPVTPVCSPASGSTFPIATTTVTCTATDAAGNASTGQFTVKVRGAAEQLQDLIAASNALPPGTALGDKARSAAASLAAGNTLTSCSTLQSYLDLVRAQTGKKLTTQQAHDLTVLATRSRAVLAC